MTISDSSSAHYAEKVVEFRTLLSQGECTLEVSCSIPIPLHSASDHHEYFAHVVATHNVPLMYHDELLSTLEVFIRREEEEWEEARDDAVIDRLLAQKTTPQGYQDVLDKTMIADGLAVATQFADSFAAVMRECDPAKVHALVLREDEMAKEVATLISLRDGELDKLRVEAEMQMEQSARRAESPRALSRINEEMRSVHESYVSELLMVADRQRREYRDIIRRLKAEPNYIPTLLGSMSCDDNENSSNESTERILEESFTIYLGAQLKTMHNARIVASTGLDAETSHAPHLRLQTAMSLYRRDLSAIIVLVGRDPRWHLQRRSELARLCERSTELHFESLESQLEAIADTVKEAARRRKIPEGSEKKMTENSSLCVGDVYCTRHSNCGSVQIVFHLVIDESEEISDMNSRHPYLNGIRNVIRMASRFGVTTLSLPLLLVKDMSEKTTPQWCLRRAELIFKCVKGYLMEICSTGWSSASLGGASLSRAPHYNINFILPLAVPVDVYTQIVSIFPSIFHLVPSVTA